MSKKNILIVGGAGYIGGALTSILLKNIEQLGLHDTITVYDSLCFESEYLKYYNNENVKFVLGDIRDRAKLLPYLDKANYVVWLAAHVGDGACTIDPAISLDINRESIKWLVDTYKYRGHIIWPSSASVYGCQNGVLTEDSPLKPLSLYAKSKADAEKYITYGSCNATILRLGTLFGVGDQFSRIRLDLVVNTLISKAFTTKTLKVFGGEQFRPLLHVANVAQAIANIILFSPQMNYLVYNLHYQNTRIIDVAHQIRASFPDIKLDITDIPFEDQRNYMLSSDRALKEGWFKPYYTIDFAINQFRSIFEQNRIKNINDIRYHNHNFFKEKRPYLDFQCDPPQHLHDEIKQMQLTSVI